MKYVHSTIGKYAKHLVLSILLLAFYVPAFSQPHLTIGKRLPKQAAENDWYHETKSMHVYRFHEGKWSLFRPVRCLRAYTCHGFIFLDFEGGTLELLHPNGKPLRPDAPARFQLQCFDSIASMEYGSTFLLFDHLGQTIAELEMKNCKGKQMIELQGMTAFCVPRHAFIPGVGTLNCDELKDWGMIGENGKWLIEPKFDSFFIFQSGVAEVRYYGVPRKINDKGEFIE